MAPDPDEGWDGKDHGLFEMPGFQGRLQEDFPQMKKLASGFLLALASNSLERRIDIGKDVLAE